MNPENSVTKKLEKLFLKDSHTWCFAYALEGVVGKPLPHINRLVRSPVCQQGKWQMYVSLREMVRNKLASVCDT